MKWEMKSQQSNTYFWAHSHNVVHRLKHRQVIIILHTLSTLSSILISMSMNPTLIRFSSSGWRVGWSVGRREEWEWSRWGGDGSGRELFAMVNDCLDDEPEVDGWRVDDGWMMEGGGWRVINDWWWVMGEWSSGNSNTNECVTHQMVWRATSLRWRANFWMRMKHRLNIMFISLHGWSAQIKIHH